MPNTEDISLPLNEFIALPTTVPFYAWYTPAFQSYLADKPYIRLVKVLINDLAVLCTNEENMETIFEELGSDFLSTYPEVYGLTFTEALQSSGIAAVQQQPYLNLTGLGVIVGIVDTGIDYTNPVFRYEDGKTKIKYIWDQTAEGPQNYGVNFGTVYTSEQINEALESDDPYSIVPHRDENGHGTYLASLAAGRQDGEFIGAAPDTDLIVVKLKKAAPFYLKKFLVPPEQENAYISIDIMLGLSFIFEQSGALGKPCSICLGLGTNFGGHNGQNRLENYISFLSNSVGTVISTAVGNESNARHHTQGIIENQGDIVPISIRVGEEAKTLSVYIWYSGWDKISFSLKSPTGEKINKIPFFVGTTYQKKLIFEKSTVNIAYHQNESRFAIVQITDVVPGTWEINLHGDLIISGDYHAWLPMTGFVSPDIEFVAPTPNYTTVIPSTALGTIAVGAYNSIEKSLYINSSWGPTVGTKFSPDFAAPGVNVQGVSRNGFVEMSGTSVSAAITTGAAALLMQWAIVEENSLALTGNRLRLILIRGCDRDTNRDYPNPQWGYGTLNLLQSFNIFREE